MNDNLDLSKLAKTAPTAGQGVSYVRDVDEASFESVANLSMQHPVIVELTLPTAAETRGIDESLIELTNQAEGRWLLARIDVGKSQRLAQALGVQAVPTVLALIAGQVAPLFQGTRDKAEVKAVLDQVVQVAVSNGLTGRAQPVPGGALAQSAAQPDNAEPVIDPRFAAADAAISRGDLGAAEAEFDKLLTANPRDKEAAAGKAQVGLVRRVQDLDVAAVMAAADAAPDDIEAQLKAADVEVAGGDPAAGFARLIGLVKRTKDKVRDGVRERLVELFSTLPPQDQTVAKARRDLTSALF
jgi:putative thioredoxin